MLSKIPPQKREDEALAGRKRAGGSRVVRRVVRKGKSGCVRNHDRSGPGVRVRRKGNFVSKKSLMGGGKETGRGFG